MTNEDIFSVLRTKGKELSDWLRENFDHYAKVTITPDGVEVSEDLNKSIKE